MRWFLFFLVVLLVVSCATPQLQVQREVQFTIVAITPDLDAMQCRREANDSMAKSRGRSLELNLPIEWLLITPNGTEIKVNDKVYFNQLVDECLAKRTHGPRPLA